MNYTADIAPINKTFLKSVDEILRNYVWINSVSHRVSLYTLWTLATDAVIDTFCKVGTLQVSKSYETPHRFRTWKYQS